MMERWRLQAIEQIERDAEHTERLAERYAAEAKRLPKIEVTENGIWHPRRTALCFERLYRRLTEAAHMSAEQLERGARKHHD